MGPNCGVWSDAFMTGVPDAVRARVQFIHYNHTNPIRYPDSPESLRVSERGFRVARAGQRHCLTNGR